MTLKQISNSLKSSSYMLEKFEAFIYKSFKNNLSYIAFLFFFFFTYGGEGGSRHMKRTNQYNKLNIKITLKKM